MNLGLDAREAAVARAAYTMRKAIAEERSRIAAKY